MQGLLCILVGSFCACVCLTPVARFLAGRWGLLDYPDARRKIHAQPIPLGGGIAVLVSVCVILAGAFGVSDTLQAYFVEHFSQVLGLLAAAVAICALGILDDFQCLRGRHKLLGQIGAIGILIACGVQIHNISLFGSEIDLGLLAIPVTLLWLLGAINSLNLLDGMDGLLSSLGFIITAAMATIAVLQGHWAAAGVAAAMGGALLGFLCYNFPPASVYLGDAGSMLIGLVVGVLGIDTSLKAPATVALVAPVAILAIPFFDTLAAILRRKLTGRSIYSTDRGHLHHCLLRHGLSVRGALLVISFLCLLTVLGALASLAMRNELYAIIATVAVIFMLVATRLFGHAELSLVVKRLRHIAASFLEIPGAGKSRRLEVHLQGTTAWSGLLEAVAEQAFELNLLTVRLEINAPAIHEHYHGQWQRYEEELDGTTLWRAEIPLGVQGRMVGRVAISGFHDPEPLVDKIAAITRLMENFESDLSANGVSVGSALELPGLGSALAEDHTLPAPHVFGVRRKGFTAEPDEEILPASQPALPEIGPQRS